MTVRQTPFTARLSPGDNSSASDVPIRNRKPRSVGLRSISSPTASTNPVNIALNHDIGPKRDHATLVEIRRRERSIAEQRYAVAAERVRRDVQAHEVDELFVPRGAMHGRTTLEQQRADAVVGNAVERRAKRVVARDLDVR